eukprot:1161564-Pelagomonas_calceolata.AAC.11
MPCQQCNVTWEHRGALRAHAPSRIRTEGIGWQRGGCQTGRVPTHCTDPLSPPPDLSCAHGWKVCKHVFA